MSQTTRPSEEVRQSRFQRYREYRESGIESLGQVPVHWRVERLKYLATLNDDVLPESTSSDLEISYVDIGCVDAVAGITEIEETVFAAAPSRARRLVRNGDVIVSTVRTYLRAIATIRDPARNLVVSTGFAVLRPRRLVSGFASYALTASHFVERVVASSLGVSYPAVNVNTLACFELPFPEEDEQRAIACFLDRETAKIDALVAQKQRLIELLQEKRNALVTRAVTLGLDPSVPMKDSGLEWMGDIPAHWGVGRLKHACERIFVGVAEAATFAYTDEGVPMLRSTDVRANEVRSEDVRYIDLALADSVASKRLRTDDIVTVRTGNAGVSAVVPEAFDGGQCFTLIVSRPAKPNHSRYLCYWLNSRPGVDQFAVQGIGTAQVNISVPIVKNTIIGLPPAEEQVRIANWIERESARWNGLIAKTRQAVDRLRELRIAVVSAAVTGKIDVRGEAP